MSFLISMMAMKKAFGQPGTCSSGYNYDTADDHNIPGFNYKELGRGYTQAECLAKCDEAEHEKCIVADFNVDDDKCTLNKCIRGEDSVVRDRPGVNSMYRLHCKDSWTPSDKNAAETMLTSTDFSDSDCDDNYCTTGSTPYRTNCWYKIKDSTSSYSTSWSPAVGPPTQDYYACKISFKLSTNLNGISKLWMTFCQIDNWNSQYEYQLDEIASYTFTNIGVTYTSHDWPNTLTQACADQEMIMGMAVQYLDSSDSSQPGIKAIATKCGQIFDSADTHHYWISTYNDHQMKVDNLGGASEGWETFYYRDVNAPVCGAAVQQSSTDAHKNTALVSLKVKFCPRYTYETQTRSNAMPNYQVMSAVGTVVTLSDSHFSRCDTDNGYFKSKCWYTVQDIDDTSRFEWKGEVTNDDDLTYLVCGIRISVTVTAGLFDLHFKYCKINDWNTQLEKTIGTSTEACDDPIQIDGSMMCSANFFITGLGYKFESTSQGISDGTIQGIGQIPFQCTEYGNKANQEGWHVRDTLPFGGQQDNSGWQTFHQSDQTNNPMFVCGANYAGVKSGVSDNVGLHALQLRYCKDPYYIYQISAVGSTTNLTPYYLVDTQVVGQSYSKTYNYNELLYYNLPTSTSLSCVQNHDPSSTGVTTSSFSKNDGTAQFSFSLTSNPTSITGDLFTITCTLSGIHDTQSATTHSINTFYYCHNTSFEEFHQQTTQSSNFQLEQTVQSSATASFDWTTFRPDYYVCRVDTYELVAALGGTSIPAGTNIVNPYNENNVVATLSSNSFSAVPIDTYKAEYYEFFMKITIDVGGAQYWSGKCKLTIYCPTTVSVSWTGTTTYYSFIGASGSQSMVEFNAFTSSSPVCNAITGYTVTQTSPTNNRITFPSQFCTTTPCRLVEFDTLEAVNIQFQITALTQINTGGTSVSPTITIIVNTEDIYIPDIVIGSLTPYTIYATNSGGTYQFDDPFSTSDPANYVITNHALQSILPATEALTLVQDSSTGKFSIAFATTTLRTITFNLYGEIQGFSSKNGLVAAQINVICGTESINFTPNLGSYSTAGTYTSPTNYLVDGSSTNERLIVFSLSNSVNSLLTTSELLSSWTSDATACPITKIVAFSDQSLTQTYVDTDNDLVLNYGTDLSQVNLQATQTRSYRKTIYLSAETALVKSTTYIKIEIIVCGTETISLVDTSSYQVSLIADQSTPVPTSSTLSSWFQVINAENSFCGTMTFEKYPAQNCFQDSTTSSEGHFSLPSGSTQLSILTYDEYTSDRICIMATTAGKKSAKKEVEVTNVCGHETIDTVDQSAMNDLKEYRSIYGEIIAKKSGVLELLYNYEIGEQTINVFEYVKFESSNLNCPITSFRLIDSVSGQTVLSTDRFRIDQTDLNSPLLNIKTDQAFSYQSFVFEASTASSSNKAYQEFKVKVCGFESYIVQDALLLNTEKFVFRNIGIIATTIDVDYYSSTSDRFYLNGVKNILEGCDNDQVLLSTDFNQRDSLTEEEQSFFLVQPLDYAEQDFTFKYKIYLNTSSTFANTYDSTTIQFKAISKGKQEHIFSIKINLQSIDFEATGLTVEEALEEVQQSQTGQTQVSIDIESLFDEIDDQSYYGLEVEIMKDAETSNLNHHFSMSQNDEMPFVEIGEVKQNQSYEIRLIKNLVDLATLAQNQDKQIQVQKDYFDEQNQKWKSETYNIKFDIEDLEVNGKETSFDNLTIQGQFDHYSEVAGTLKEPELICSDPNAEIKSFCETNLAQCFSDEQLQYDIEPSQSDERLFKHTFAFQIDGICLAERQYIEKKEFTQDEINEAALYAWVDWAETYEFESAKLSTLNTSSDIVFTPQGSDDCLAFMSNPAMKKALELLNIGPSSCLSIKGDGLKPLKLQKVRLSETHELTLQFSEDLIKYPMSFVREYINEKVIDLRARSAIDYEEVYQGQHIYKKDTYEKELTQEMERLEFTWNVTDYRKREIVVQCNFTNKGELSQTTFGKDELEVNILNNPYIVSKYFQKLEVGEYHAKSLFPISQNPLILGVKNTIEASKDALQGIEGSSLGMQIVVAGSTQTLWGLLNTQIILNHFALIQIPMPASSSVFVTVMGTMNSKDKYDTDYFYSLITDFGEYDPYNDWHEKQAYDGTNFLPLAGSLVIDFFLILVPGFFIVIVNRLSRRLHRIKTMRKIGAKLEKTEIKVGLFRLFYEQYIELSVSVSVCLIYFFDNLKFEDMEIQDRVSLFCCVALGLFLVIIPFFMCYKLYQIKDLLDDEETVEEYDYIFSNIQTQNIYQASYNIVFSLRRALIIASLYLINETKVSLQLVLNVAVQLIYLMYICAFSPLESKNDRIMEVINECLTLVVTYFYMLMCDSNYNSVQRDSYIGVLHVFITVGMLLANFLLLLWQMGHETIPELYQEFKEFRKSLKLEGVLEEWEDEKKEKYHGDVSNYVLEKQYFELKDYIRLTKQKQGLKQKEEELNKEQAWLKENNLDQSCIKKELQQLQLQKAAQEEAYGQFTKMYGHSGIEIKVSQTVVGAFLVSTLDVDSKEDLSNRHEFLMHFLRFENFMQVDFPYPSNGGLKSFATRMSSDPQHFRRIKQQIDQNDEFEDIKLSLGIVESFYNGINIKQLLKAAIMQDIPFVVLSDQFKDRTIGICFEPDKSQKGQKSPIYLLQEGSNFRMILHKSQIYAAKHIQKQGLTVRKFQPSDPKQKEQNFDEEKVEKTLKEKMAAFMQRMPLEIKRPKLKKQKRKEKASTQQTEQNTLKTQKEEVKIQKSKKELANEIIEFKEKTNRKEKTKLQMKQKKKKKIVKVDPQPSLEDLLQIDEEEKIEFEVKEPQKLSKRDARLKANREMVEEIIEKEHQVREAKIKAKLEIQEQKRTVRAKMKEDARMKWEQKFKQNKPLQEQGTKSKSPLMEAFDKYKKDCKELNRLMKIKDPSARQVLRQKKMQWDLKERKKVLSKGLKQTFNVEMDKVVEQPGEEDSSS